MGSKIVNVNGQEFQSAMKIADGWYDGPSEFEQEELQVVGVKWKCPKEDCNGEMIFNGATWQTDPIGYHHTCNECQYTVAIREKKFPTIAYVKKNNKE